MQQKSLLLTIQDKVKVIIILRRVNTFHVLNTNLSVGMDTIYITGKQMSSINI